MSLRLRIIDRVRHRPVGAPAYDLEGLSPDDCRAFVLHRLETAILPRRLRLAGHGIDVTIDACAGRITAARCRSDGSPPADFAFAPEDAGTDAVRDLDCMLRSAFSAEEGVTLVTEPLEWAPDDAGIAPSRLAGPAPDDGPFLLEPDAIIDLPQTAKYPQSPRRG